VIGVFKRNAQNIKTFILPKLLYRFQPNTAQRKGHKTCFAEAKISAKKIQDGGRRPSLKPKNCLISQGFGTVTHSEYLDHKIHSNLNKKISIELNNSSNSHAIHGSADVRDICNNSHDSNS